jgi:phosphatidylglycerophosphate synthase
MTNAGRPPIIESYHRLQAAQKSSKGAPLYSVLVNRRLGRALAAVAHRLGLTPNTVSVISAAFTYSGIVLLFVAEPTLAVSLVVCGLLVIGYALDAADGQLARLRGGGTLSGEWLDHVVDSGKIASLHLGVLVMIHNWYGVPEVWLAVPIVFTVVTVVHFFGMLLTELLIRPLTRQGSAEPVRGASKIVAALKLPTDYGVLCLAFATAHFPSVFLWIYLLLAVGSTGYTLLVLPVWYRRVRRFDTGAQKSEQAG